MPASLAVCAGRGRVAGCGRAVGRCRDSGSWGARTFALRQLRSLAERNGYPVRRTMKSD